MANRRMFSLTVVDTDRFIDMPTSARLLYYDIGMRADDEGFLDGVKRIMRVTGASDDDLRVLIARQFVIPFQNGVIVVRHWNVNNQLRKDRAKSTICTAEKALLFLKNSGEYELIGDGRQTVAKLPTGRQPNDNQRLPQYSIGKEREEEENAAPSDSFGLLSDDELDILRENHSKADLLIARYHLPDGDMTRESLLEDAESFGWDKLEAALKTAATSNSRERVSVAFYRSILNGSGGKKNGGNYDGVACV